MEGKIYKQENIYVVLGEDILGNSPTSIPQLVVDFDCGDAVFLYGGRVILEDFCWSDGDDACNICIDGIKINTINFSESQGWEVTESISIKRVVAYLNQIENLGVDTFLENYRIETDKMKKELESIADKFEIGQANQPDEQQKSLIKNLRNVISEIICMVFLLSINMNAGLDNHKYIEAYDAIVSML